MTDKEQTATLSDKIIVGKYLTNGAIPIEDVREFIKSRIDRFNFVLKKERIGCLTRGLILSLRDEMIEEAGDKLVEKQIK